MWVVCAHVIMKFFVSLFVFFPFLKQPRSKVWKMEVSVLLIYSQLTFMTFILHDQKRRSPPGVGKGYRPSPPRLVKIMVNIDCGQNELLRMHLMAIIENLVFNFFFLVDSYFRIFVQNSYLSLTKTCSPICHEHDRFKLTRQVVFF